jgi:hypothetical protein
LDDGTRGTANCHSCGAHPHFYEDERGFQGALYAELYRRLGEMAMLNGAILREEYQKRLGEHGLTIRPDIILHEPFNPARHQSRARTAITQ